MQIGYSKAIAQRNQLRVLPGDPIGGQAAIACRIAADHQAFRRPAQVTLSDHNIDGTALRILAVQPPSGFPSPVPPRWLEKHVDGE